MSVTSSQQKSRVKVQKLTAALLQWFAVNARDLPWRRTHDPYAIWGKRDHVATDASENGDSVLGTLAARVADD